jgi:PAS domain S-box-containing protein
VGIKILERWQSSVFDSAFTIGAVALGSLVHFALGEQFAGRTPFLVSMLAVLVSATRGGFAQGIFATVLILLVELSVWGEWQWLIPDFSTHHFVEIVLFVLEAVMVSLMAEFYLNGRLALRQSLTRFQVLFDSIPVGAMIHYQSKLVAVNQTFADMFGYRQQELIGIRPSIFVAPESQEEVRQHAQSNSEESYRIKGVRQNGTTFPVEVLGKNIHYQGHPMRVTVMRDLTEHLIAHQRLEQMNEMLEARVAERTLELNQTVESQRADLENVNTFSGLLPICGS